VSLQDENGALYDAHDSGWINTDNNMGYALSSLYFAFVETGEQKYVDALKAGLSWMAEIQNADGSWYHSYKRYGDVYASAVPGYYADLGILDIKTVDAIQSFFAYNLWLYYEASGDEDFMLAHIDAARAGIDRLIEDNLDENGRFFYSSWHLKSSGWKRYEIKYAMGQGDVYLGLKALYALTGEEKYEEAALQLKENFDGYYFDEAVARYGIGIDSDDEIDDELYILAQSAPTFFMERKTRESVLAFDYLAALQGADGAIGVDDSAITDTACAMAAAKTLGDDDFYEAALPYLLSMQVLEEGDGMGAFKYDKVQSEDNLSNLYSNVTAFSVFALSSLDHMPVP
jgi:hypothetical protein